MLSPNTLLAPFLRLSVEDFPRIAVACHGEHADMGRTWPEIEPVARTLLDGFHTTLDDSRLDVLVPRLDAVDVELRGIAYEGAGMGLTLLDRLFPWKERVAGFLAGPGAPYRMLVHIGAGLALARMPGNPERAAARHNPFQRWLVIDGYGFHEGFFSWKRSLTRHAVPAGLRGYSRRAFDQGLGRSVWFSATADVDRITSTIDGFPATRRPDLWSGVGLACAYAAGIAERRTVERLLEAADPHGSHLAVGTAMAAVIREQSGHPAPHTELACDVVWGRESTELALWAGRARRDLPNRHPEPPYETWRRRLAGAWAVAAGPDRDREEQA